MLLSNCWPWPIKLRSGRVIFLKYKSNDVTLPTSHLLRWPLLIPRIKSTFLRMADKILGKLLCLSPPASSSGAPPPPPATQPPILYTYRGRGIYAQNSGVIFDAPGLWVRWVQGKVRMTAGLAFFRQANTSISHVPWDSQEFWEVSPWASEEGRAKGGRLGVLVLNSSLPHLWSGFLIC